MKIRALFLSCMAAIAIITLALAAIIATTAWNGMSASRAGIAAAANFEIVLKAIEMTALERSPTNSILVIEPGADPAAAARLAEVRRDADLALRRLGETLPPGMRNLSDNFRRAVEDMRQAVDRDAALPRAQRSADAVATHLARFMGMSRFYEPILSRVSIEVAKADPDLAKLTTLAAYSSELREVANNKSSTVAPGFRGKRPLTPQEIIAADRLDGSITQLRRNIEQLLSTIESAPAIEQAWTTVKTGYFEEGAGLVNALLEIGRKSGDYGEAGPRFLANITAKHQMILALRDAALAVARQEAQAKQSKAETGLLVAGGAIIVILVVIGTVVLVISRRVVSPLVDVTGRTGQLAAGNRDIDIPYRDRKDEIGAMAKAVESFRLAAVENDRLQQEAAAARQREEERRLAQSEEEHRAAEEKLRLETRQQAFEAEMQAQKIKQMEEADAARQRQAEADRAAAVAKEQRMQAVDMLLRDFESMMDGVLQKLDQASGRMNGAALEIGTSASHTSAEAGNVTDASQETDNNLQIVATAAEELSASIREISGQVARTSNMAGAAADQGQEAQMRIRQLDEIARDIGNVVELIRTIAGQTNLLALNATIEAARAGDAGKGFAVVASEVKNLASQTAKATDDIAKQIGGIQSAVSGTVETIEAVVATIGTLREAATTIASAVEQQSAATGEIAQNIQQASASVKQVSHSAAEVLQAARQSAGSASEVKTASSDVTVASRALKKEVLDFQASIKSVGEQR